MSGEVYSSTTTAARPVLEQRQLCSGEREPQAQCLPRYLPLYVADSEQKADSEQIRVATIALHTEQEKTRNLQDAQVSHRRDFHSLRVSHLLLWADLHFCHTCYSL